MGVGAFGEGGLGELSVFAEGGESVGEGHGVYQWGWGCVDHRWAFLSRFLDRARELSTIGECVEFCGQLVGWLLSEEV